MSIETAPRIVRDAFKPGDHVVLVDGSGYIFRAYHALPPLTRKSDGLPVGAVAGFCNMVWKLLCEPVMGAKPSHLAVIFDASAVTFRNEIFDGYKAHRPEPPDDLRPQFPLIREAVRAFNVACVEQDGYEADDLIATYARLAREAGAQVLIVSSDKDLMQLVSDTVVMWDPMKERRIGPAEVLERFGVPPEKVVEVQALAGDSIDNVPGVPGIGVKTAAQLIAGYGDLENLLAHAAEIKQPKRRESLIAFADQARISRRLCLLDERVPLACAPEHLAVRDVEGQTLLAFLKALEFNTLTRRVAERLEVDSGAVEPNPHVKSAGRTAPAQEYGGEPAEGAGGPAEAPQSGRERDQSAAGPTPAALAARRREEAARTPFDHSAYEAVTSPARLQAWVEEAVEGGVLAVDTETDGLDAMQARLVGISLATAPGRACYVPLRHRRSDGLALEGDDIEQIPVERALALLKPVLEDRGVLKVGQNVKFDWLVLAREGIEIEPFHDTMLMSYVLEAGGSLAGHGMDELSERWLGHKPIPFAEVAGTGRSRVSFDLVPLDRATAYSAEDADVTFRLWRVLAPQLVAQGLVTVYETLERPMVTVLARMERRGVSIDRATLSRLSGEFAQAAGRIEAEIHEIAGQPFAVGSPAQVGEILFGKFKFPGGTRTKTGAWATRATMLEELAEAGHELPRRILDWRQLTKLKATYTDALVGCINGETGRVHTCFQLASTSTGRLSSSDPNLQNIPIRTEEGRKIRRAFVAEPGHLLLSADYSQIELRLLAHMADIAELKRAFAKGIDIHALTASEVFGVPLEGVTPDLRRKAKTINFGIIYGISAFGLATRLNIPREEAGAFIRLYFDRFPGIRDYIERTKAQAREKGYVTTLFGRRAHYPDIRAGNPQVRAFNERAAINAPIQGTAADIIRRAMIRIDPALAEARLGARMLLQVHDELVFEVPEEEVEATLPVVRRVMEQAPLPALALSVPLAVEARAAPNWEEAH